MNDDGLTKIEERLLTKVNDLEDMNEELTAELEKAINRINKLEKVLKDKNIQFS